MDNGIAGAAAMPRPMPLPTRAVVSESLAQDRDRPETTASRPDPENPSSTPAEPDPVPQTVSTQAASGETRQPFMDQLQGMADQMTRQLQAQGRSLEFVVNGGDSEDVVILIRDSESGQVMRTIPPDELANLSQQVRDGGPSLVNARA
ncbi:MAG: flagellar protein FlaG [Wenzhouxiangella sp.]